MIIQRVTFFIFLFSLFPSFLLSPQVEFLVFESLVFFFSCVNFLGRSHIYVFLCFGAHRYLGCLVYLFCFVILVFSCYSLVGLSVGRTAGGFVFPPSNCSPTVILLLLLPLRYARGDLCSLVLSSCPLFIFSSIKKKQSYLFLRRLFFFLVFIYSILWHRMRS